MILFNENINIAKGVSYMHTFYLLDNDKTVIPTGDFTFKLQMRESYSTSDIMIDCTNFLDADTYSEQGIVFLNIPANHTALINKSKGLYDLKATRKSTGDVFEISRGLVRVRETVSKVV